MISVLPSIPPPKAPVFTSFSPSHLFPLPAFGSRGVFVTIPRLRTPCVPTPTNYPVPDFPVGRAALLRPRHPAARGAPTRPSELAPSAVLPPVRLPLTLKNSFTLDRAVTRLYG